MPHINQVQGLSLYAVSMTAISIQAWTSLYLAVSLCASLCATLALGATMYELYVGAWRPSLRSKGDVALALPRIWMHYQLKYLTGAPVILAIALLYANHLGFSKLAGM